MITIVIHAYEICTENVIKLIVCLEPGRGIDRHAYKDTVAAAYRYRYSLQISRPRLGRWHRFRLDHGGPKRVTI